MIIVENTKKKPKVVTLHRREATSREVAVLFIPPIVLTCRRRQERMCRICDDKEYLMSALTAQTLICIRSLDPRI